VPDEEPQGFAVPWAVDGGRSNDRHPVAQDRASDLFAATLAGSIGGELWFAGGEAGDLQQPGGCRPHGGGDAPAAFYIHPIKVTFPAADLARDMDDDIRAFAEARQGRLVGQVAADHLGLQVSPEWARRLASGEDAHLEAGVRQRPHHMLPKESGGPGDGGQAPRGAHAPARSSS